MKLGMLWRDDDPKTTLDQKVEGAASYYRNKYGRIPNICFVHPTMLAFPEVRADASDDKRHTTGSGVEVRSSRSVMPNHFWIGVETP